MLFKKPLFVFASMLALCAPVIEAKTVALTSEDRGILGAMHRAGCNPLLLSRVMLDSRILPGQLSNLPVGTTIVVPDECATQAPTHQEAKLTRQIFNTQSVLKSVEGVTKKNESLANELAEARAKMAVMSINISEYLSRIHSLESAKQLLQQKNKKMFWALCGCIAFAGGLSLALCIVLFIWRSKHSTVVLAEKESREVRRVPLPVRKAFSAAIAAQQVMFHGELIPFRDTTKYTRGCPLCLETGIKDDLEAIQHHLATKHVYLRVKEIPSLEEWEEIFPPVS